MRFAHLTSFFRRHSWFFFWGVILLAAVGLRFYKLGTVPAVMHRDEVSIGYNAYALLETGQDEHGKPWPLNFQSFGDYKLPGMIYSVLGSLMVFGRTAWAVRFPTALAAVLTIPAVFWLVQEFGWSRRIGVWATVLITFGFWHISQARNAYEPMIGVLFSVTSLATWLAGQRNWKWYGVTVALYLVSGFFYNVPFLLLPILFLVTWLIQTSPRHWREAIQSSGLYAGASIAGVFLLLSLLFWGVNQSRSQTTIFSHSDLVEESQSMVHASLVGGMISPLARIGNHNFLLSGVQFFRGYFAVFDFTYVFFEGDHNPWHNLQSIDLGNINPVLIVPFVIGVFLLIQQWKEKKSQLVLAYLFLTPVISALTIDSPITNRLLDFHVAVLIVAAIGVDFAYQKLWISRRSVWHTAVWVIGTLAYSGFFTLFLIRYFFSYNQLMPPLWNPGLPAVISEVNQRLPDYDWVFITSDLELGYIHFAFHTPFTPTDFQDSAMWYKSGFDQVSEYEQYRFSRFPEWTELSSENVSTFFDDDHNRILIIGRGQPPKEKESQIMWREDDWRGRTRWYMWETDTVHARAAMQGLSPTPDRQKVREYLLSCESENCNVTLLDESATLLQ